MLLELVEVHVAGAAANLERTVVFSITLLKIEYFDCVQHTLVFCEFVDTILV